MSVGKYIEQYGTAATSILIKKIADQISNAEDKQVLIDMANDLQAALEDHIAKGLSV